MGEWKEYRLGEICSKIGSGATPRGGSNSYVDFGISLIRSQNVLDFRFAEIGLAFIDSQQADELRGVIVEENDIFFNITYNRRYCGSLLYCFKVYPICTS